MKKPNIFTIFFQNILEIMEDQPDFLIPDQIYFVAIMIYYFQASGFFFAPPSQKP